MSRSSFGGTYQDWLMIKQGNLLALKTGTATLTFWSTWTGSGTPSGQYTDLLDQNNNPVSSIVVNGYQIPRFSGPDNITGMWAWDGSGTDLFWMEARNVALTAARRIAAPTGIAATDTANVQAAINAGGEWELESGTYLCNVVMKSGAYLNGGGVGQTILKAPNASNSDVILSENFATYTGGTSQAGPSHWGISNMTVDGNGANQSSGPSWCMRVYASCYRIANVEFKNGYSGEVWSEWGSSGSDMEAHWEDVKILGQGTVNSHGKGLDWQGPHDSLFTNLIVNSADGQNGVHIHGNAGGERFTNIHIWGVHDVNLKVEKPAHFHQVCAEGATVQNVLWLCNKGTYHGEVFGTNGTNPTETGFQFGDATHTGLYGNSIDIITHNWGAGSVPFTYNSAADTGGNYVRVMGRKGAATAFRVNNPNVDSFSTFICEDAPTESVTWGTPHSIFASNATFALRVSDGTNDVFRVQTGTSPRIMQYANGARVMGYTDASYTTETWRLDSATGAIQPGTSTGRGGKFYSGSGAPGTVSGSAAGDLYLRTDTPGTIGQQLYEATAANTWTPVGAASTDIQTFTASGTWNKPAGAVAVTVLCIGAGGGGGGGARYGAGVLATGGGGGSGGGWSLSAPIPASLLPSSATVTVGTAGTSGAAATGDTTDGSAGGAGGQTVFGSIAAGSAYGLRAQGGNAGGAGNTAGAAAGGGSAGYSMAGAAGGAGGGSSATGAAGNAGSSGGPAGGGAGGGITTANAANAGGAGGGNTYFNGGGGTGGVVGGASPTAGASPAAGVPAPGAGGGGGAASTTGAAQTGAAGGTYGGGGGGGGSSRNGNAAGAGGAGGGGLVIVTTEF